jgi:hypothetical protein
VFNVRLRIKKNELKNLKLFTCTDLVFERPILLPQLLNLGGLCGALLSALFNQRQFLAVEMRWQHFFEIPLCGLKKPNFHADSF